jgi:1,4-alpha-glucan branching enzyme
LQRQRRKVRRCSLRRTQSIEGGDAESNVFSFVRYGDEGTPSKVVISNMASVLRENFR